MQVSSQSSRIQHIFAVTLCLFFAIALQIQATFFQTDTYEGIRLNLADFGLPVAVIFILGSLALKKTRWPAFEKPFSLWWIIALTFLLSLALLKGYFDTGEWNRWALINKYAGWFILLAYFGAGAWVSANFKNIQEQYFLKTFGLFFALSTLALILLALAKLLGIYTSPILVNPYEGLMANTNAYAFLLAAATGFITLGAYKEHKITAASGILWTCLPYVVLLSGSRTMWICFLLLSITFVVMDWRSFLRLLLPAMIVGSLICVAFTHNDLQKAITKRPYKEMTILYKTMTSEGEAAALKARKKGSDLPRLETMKTSIAIWKENPVIGGGLGASSKAQIVQHEEMIVVVHNTILWILADMGAIGALAFAGTYIAMLLALRNAAIAEQGFYLAAGALIMLLLFGLISQVHEILYTRFMWFILGLALARLSTHPAG